MYFSYRWRKKVYNEAKTGMYAEDETPETKNLEWEMLSRLIDNKKLKKKVTALKKQREIEEDYVGIERDIENSSGNIFAFAGETSINGSTSAIAKKRENGSKSDTHQRHKMSYEILDDFYGRPPKSRIKKLGRNGLSWRLLYMMLPWRILNIGKSTLTVSGNDKLYLMPQVFTLNVTYRVSVQIFTIILIAFGALIYRFSPSLYVPGMITGFYWMLGGLIFGLLLLWLDTRMTRKYEKGMLKLLRSIGEPKIPEIMFSYSWACRKKCVRTLAHSLWRSGIGVWIDSIKLVSGDTLEQDVRRAVREVNFTVIFLSPNYVKSRNCQIEFTEAIKTPGKLHVHVSDWNSEVEKVVARLIEDIKLSKNRITAHSSAENKAGLVRGIWKYLSSSISKKKVNKDEEEGLASKSSKLISNLKKTGRGWADLTAVLHNYSKRSGNSWDFGWWLMNTQSGGGIPNCAPCPPKVEKWNLRPFYPLSNPVRNIRDYFAWKSGVKIGNVYISGDCSKTGTNGSAIPWKFLIFLVVALFPLLDIIDFNFQETKLRQFTDNCITELSRQISSKNNGVDVRNAVCNKFYELPIFTTPNSGYEVGMYSAYKNEVVIQGFSKLYNSNCNQTVQATTNLKNPAAVQYLVPCTADLTMWFANNASFIPRGIVWAVICMISVLFLLTIFTNLEKIVETTFRIPTCLRPLLAVSNLKQAPKDLPSTAKPTLLRRLTKMGSSLGTMATDILKEEAPVSYTPPAIPLLYVRVHGRGEIADNLRKFFNNLDRHLPDTIQCRDIFTLKKKSEEISIVKNNVTKDGDGFAWVNIFIMSDVEDMKLFYELNQQNKIDLEVSVVILDHQPLDREEKIEYDVLKFKDWNMLKEDEVWSSWIRTIVYIESRYRIKGKLGVVEELKNFEMGYEVVMNASLRTKNALFKYGEEVFCDSIYGK
ncbi:hypothetical protein HK098_003080 [Nowakowskiella sp. JEL0407]|nr:hypothetical protein HK098_003080 [Nowakowskiella sp. JEL0407]